MKKIAMILALAFTGIAGVAIGQTPKVMVSDKTGWHKISDTTVDLTKEKDEIVVLGADSFASIKFKVVGQPINLVSAEVVYETGENQDVAILFHEKDAGYSRIIDLQGGERDISKIVLIYKTLPNPDNKKAHVELWGLKTNAKVGEN